MAEWERARLPVQGHPQLLQAGDVTSAGTPPIIRLNTQRARVVTKTRGVFTGGARAGCQGHPSLRGTRCAGHRLLAGRPPAAGSLPLQVDLEPAPPSARLAGGLAARETRV